MKRTKFNLLAVLSLFTALAFTACSDDEEMNNVDDDSKGTANIAATDAAVDAENITGVYLAVKGVKVDGVDDANDAEIMFNATEEFNLMAYQNGETYGLGSIDLEAGSYSNISFILDDSKPAYVKFKDNTESTIDIEGQSSNEYEIVGDFDIEAESQTDLVADVDLRKALHKSSAEGKYTLRTTARLVEANIAGTIEGTVENYDAMKEEMEQSETKAKLVVYAYAEGTFKDSEMDDEDGDGVKARFENSVNSAVVAEDGTFTLAFMEEADYEIVVAKFEKAESAPEEEEYEYNEVVKTKLTVDGSLNVLLDGLGVSANSSTNVSIRLGLGS